MKTCQCDLSRKIMDSFSMLLTGIRFFQTCVRSTNNNKVRILLIALLVSIVAIAVRAQNVPSQVLLDQSQVSRLTREIQAVHSMIMTNDFDAAQKMLNALQTNYGHHPLIVAELKLLLRQKKDYAALKELIDEELKASPGNFELMCQLGEVYFLSDSLIKAKQAWETALKKAGDEEYRYAMIAGYYLSYGFYTEAIDVYRQARAVFKDSSKFSNELIDIYVAQRNFAEAIGEYLAQIERDPNAANEISLQVSFLAGQIDDPAIIRRELLTALNRFPRNPEIHRMVGELELRTGNVEAALDYYKKADDLAKSNGQYLLSFAGTCYANGHYAMATRAADLYLSGGPSRRNYGQALLLKANSLNKLGQTQQALALYSELRQNADPNLRTEAALAAGEILASIPGRRKEGIELFSQGAISRPKTKASWIASLRLAESYAEDGDWPKARNELKLLKRDPSAPEDIVESAMFLSAELAFYSLEYDSAAAEYNELIARIPSGKLVNDCLERLNLLEAGRDQSLRLLTEAERFMFEKKIDSAMIKLEAAIEANGTASQYAALSLAKLHSIKGAWDKAAATYERYIEKYVDGIYLDQALLALAEIYVDKISSPQKAAPLANRILSEFPKSPLVEKARLVLSKSRQPIIP